MKRRILLQGSSDYRLGAQIVNEWQKGSTLALLKPDATPAAVKHVLAAFDPHALVDTNASTTIERDTQRDRLWPIEDGSITVFTSGTTGPPKGVVIPRAAAIGNSLKTASIHGIGHGRAHGTCLPLYHVNALFMSLLGCHLTGEKLAISPGGNPSRFFRELDRAGARTGSVNPTELRKIVDERPRWPDSLDYLITAAGPLSSTLASSFYDLYGPRLRQGYGMSEAVNFSFIMPQLDAADFKSQYIHSLPPVGLALPDTEFRISDNELLVRSPDRMSGYLAGVPSPIDSSGWLRTGDAATLRDGFLVLRGRISDAIRTSMDTSIPIVDVEQPLKLSAKAREYAAIRIPTDSERDQVGLYVQGNWTSELSRELLRNADNPLVLVRTGRLALSPSGKVHRTTMTEEAESLMALLRKALASTITRRQKLLEQALFHLDGKDHDRHRTIIRQPPSSFAGSDDIFKPLARAQLNFALILETPSFDLDARTLKHWEDLARTYKSYARFRGSTLTTHILWADSPSR